MKLRTQRGFTLFEIIVAIAIVGLIMGLVVSRMDSYLDLDMKKTSNKLAATIRYLYNKSVTDGTYIRLVLDLDERTYWVEATSDPTKISEDMDSGGDEDKKGTAKAQEKEKTPAEGEETDGTTKTEQQSPVNPEDTKLKYPKPQFGQMDSFLLKPVKIPDSVFFKDVFVEHLPSGVGGGKVAIYFFPNGYVEHAIVNLRNEDDDYYYSLETNPATGKVAIENEYKTMESKGK